MRFLDSLPWISALRARALISTVSWSTVIGMIAWPLSDRVYRFQVATGVDPRPVALIELTVVIGVCTVPAIAAPQLWSWERSGARPILHFLSATFAPAAILLVAFIPKFLERTGETVGVEPTTAFINAVLFSGLALVGTIWLGRRLGPLVGIVGYIGGVTVQALEVSWPFPLEAAQPSTASLVVATATILGGATLLGVTFGRASRSLDL